MSTSESVQENRDRGSCAEKRFGQHFLLAAKIAESRERILKSWETRVRKISPELQDLNTLCLWDTFPAFMNRLGEALNDPSRIVKPDDFSGPAYEHARERAALPHFQIAQVTIEYDVLRSVLLEILDEDGSLEPEPRNIILDVIFSSLSSAISQFAKIQFEHAEKTKTRADVSELRYLNLVDHLQHAIPWIVDAQTGRFVFVGKAAKSLLGYDTADWLLDPTFIAKHSHSEDYDQMMNLLEKVIKTGNDENFQHRMIAASGQDVWFQTSIQPERDSSGNITHVRGFCFEITGIKNAQEEGLRRLELSKKDVCRLSQEHELRDQFIAMLTHDLRSPLASAKMSAQLLERGVGDQANSVKRIVSNLNRADQMIRNLLDANRIKAGEPLPLKFGRMDLSELLKETLESSSETHGRRFILATSENLSGVWSADGLRRAMENLLNNAAKYGAADKPITVTAQNTNGRIQITVHNEGLPIPVGEQAELFERFKRAKNAERNGVGGWGLGLTLVKGIAEAHKGRVWVHSAAGSGTTFGMDFPFTLPGSQEMLPLEPRKLG